jgi:hypothetical protein
MISVNQLASLMPLDDTKYQWLLNKGLRAVIGYYSRTDTELVVMREGFSELNMLWRRLRCGRQSAGRRKTHGTSKCSCNGGETKLNHKVVITSHEIRMLMCCDCMHAGISGGYTVDAAP